MRYKIVEINFATLVHIECRHPNFTPSLFFTRQHKLVNRFFQSQNTGKGREFAIQSLVLEVQLVLNVHIERGRLMIIALQYV
jgi:hypothetical protein